jgi:hypothetical protein
MAGAEDLVGAPVVEPVLDTAAAARAALVNEARAALLASGTAITTTEAAAARGAHRLVTVAHDDEAVIPAFQLDERGDPNPLAADAVQALLAAGYGAWDVWDWAETPNPWIGRRTPAEAIRSGDRAAVEAAVAAAVGEGPDA